MAVKYIDWKPVSINYINNKLNLQDEYVGSKEGILFAENNLASSIRSLDFNENSVVYLTDLTSIQNIQTSASRQPYRNNLIRNCIVTAASGYYVTRTRYDSANIATSAENLNNVFQLEFDENDDALSIVSEDLNGKLYLTIDNTGACAYFDVYNSDIEHRQKFKYILNTDVNTLVLFCSTCDTSGYRVVSYDETRPGTSLVALESFTTKPPTGCYTYLFKLQNVDLSIKTNALSASTYVKYLNNLDNRNTIYSDLPVASSTPFLNNYLFVNTFKDDTSYNNSTYKTNTKSNAVSLKNLFTSDYTYNRKSDGSVLNREYQSVILGDNIVNDSFNKATVTYTTSTKQLLIIPDRLNFFHYPYDAPTVSLSAAGLIEAGAIAGLSPSKSDRIWKKQSGYAAYTIDGQSTIQNGTWLCSWLSGNNCNSQWMDRWYDASKLTYKVALSADEPNPYIIDKPSIMTFESGVRYTYFHIGSEYSLQLIENSSFNTGTKILEIKNWTYDDLPVVNGSSKNITYTRTNNSEFTFTGSEYIGYSAAEAFFPEYTITLAAWVNFDNWSNASADQIIGNYYDGGYGLFYDTGIKDDFVIYIDSTYGHLFTINTEGRSLYDKSIPGVSATITDMSIDGNGIAWVLDDNQNKIFLYNPQNNVYEKIIELPIPRSYKFVCHDKDNNFYLYSNNDNYFTKYSSEGTYVGATALASLPNTFLNLSALQSFPISGFFVDSSNNIQPYIGYTACQDTSGNYWHYFGSNLTKNNSEYVLHITSPEDIKFDGDYNIWMIKDRTLYHFDKNGNILLKKYYAYLSSHPKKIALTRELTETGWKDFVWVVDNQALVKYSANGRFEKIIKMTDYFNSSKYLGRDRNKLKLTLPKNCTKYNFDRDAKKLNPGTLDANYITAKFELTNGVAITSKMLKSTTNTLQKGWHHIALIVDTSKGIATLYIDGQSRDSVSFAAGQYRLNYTNKNNFYIGNTNGKQDLNINDWLLDYRPTMIGKIDDVRVYEYALTERDIVTLSRKRLKFVPIEFNMLAPIRQHVETIDKFTAHRLPGFKSNVYNIRILNSSIDNDEIKNSIQNAICNAITKITPVGSKLNKIVWE